MLQTQLQHVNTKAEVKSLVTTNKNVVICCGRMGPMCIPVYSIMKRLETEYPQVVFADMDFDIPDADIIKTLPECNSFRGLPFTVYYRDGKVVQATSSIQTREQMLHIVTAEFLSE